MKWVRRILAFIAVLVLVTAVAGVLVYRRIHARPAWYQAGVMDAQEREAAAGRFEDKLVETRNWVAGRRGGPPRASERSDNSLTLRLTQEELNAFVWKWEEASGLGARYAKFVKDPEVFLRDGHVILAANAVPMDTVVSVELAPRVEEGGDLRLEVASVRGGDLPLPESFWRGYSRRLSEGIAKELPSLIRDARLKGDGSANNALTAAVLLRMALQFLEERPASPIVFIPSPARVTKVSILDGEASITLQMLTPPDGEAALADLKRAEDSAER